MPKKVFGVFCLGKPDKPKQITHTSHISAIHLKGIYCTSIWYGKFPMKGNPSEAAHSSLVPCMENLYFNPRLLDQFFGKETCSICRFFQAVGVSKNRGTPKWMVYNGKPYQNGWFGGKKNLFSETSYVVIFYEAVNSWDVLWSQWLGCLLFNKKRLKGVQTNLGDKSIWIVMSNWTCFLCLLYFTSQSSLIAWKPNLKKSIWRNLEFRLQSTQICHQIISKNQTKLVGGSPQLKHISQNGNLPPNRGKHKKISETTTST